MKAEEGQSNGSEKKDDEDQKEANRGDIKKSELYSIKGESEKRGEKLVKGESQEGKLDENFRHSLAQNHTEKEHTENKARKPSEHKTPQGLNYADKVPNGDQHKCGKKDEQSDYPLSAYSPRTISLKHYSRSYLTYSGALDGMENNNTGSNLKQKWENERQPIQESPQVYSGSSHFPMTRLSSAVLPHYSNYVHQSGHGNTDSIYEYPGSYPHRSFMQRHSSQ